MSDKIYTPEVITSEALPVAGDIAISAVSSISSVVTAKTDTAYESEVVVPKRLPQVRIAQQTISESIDTQMKRILGVYEFGELGAISVGKYVNTVSGDIRISPNGITARNVNGETTFSLDGTTGNATFKGTIQSGAIISGEVIVGDNKIIINGADKTIIVNDGTNDRILIGYLPGMF